MKLLDEFSWETLNLFLGDRFERKLAANTWVWRSSGAIPTFKVRLYGTVVAEVGKEHVRLDSGGWQTATTKDRMNRALYPIGWRVDQIKHVWQVRNLETGETRDYVDGMELKK